MGLGDQFKQSLLQSILSGAQQPTAQLGETQAATAASGASAALSSASTPGATARSTMEQAGANQLAILQQAGKYFQSHATKDGYVSPQDYNNYKAQYVGAGGGGHADDFDRAFADNYVDPNNAFYDTPDAKIARGSLSSVKTLLDQYFNMGQARTQNGPQLQGLQGLGNLPVVGPLIQAKLQGPEKAYGDALNGEVSKIRGIVNAGQGQGFRFNLNELNNIEGNLPGPYDSPEIVNKKLDTLNDLLTNSMGMKSVKQGNKTLEPLDQVRMGMY